MAYAKLNRGLFEEWFCQLTPNADNSVQDLTTRIRCRPICPRRLVAVVRYRFVLLLSDAGE